jgi:predicted nucleotidyltransferase
MHIYAFGSVCRGEIDHGSDIDMLACIKGGEPPIDAKQFSIYTYDKLQELWRVGNPFVWHLHFESKLVFSCDGSDFLSGLGVPAKYQEIEFDLAKFRELFDGAVAALMAGAENSIFNLSCVFLAVRNAAMCYSIYCGKAEFSRYSALNVEPVLPVSRNVYEILVRARLLSSRGYGSLISKQEVAAVVEVIDVIRSWMDRLEENTNETRI